MSEELKTCPFCGGKAQTTREKFGHRDGKALYVQAIECSDCGAQGESFYEEDYEDSFSNTYEETKQAAVDAWNRRR